MANGAIQSYLYFALRFLTAHQNQQQQQSQQSSGQLASSPGCITQGASGTSRMSYVTHNMGPSSSAGLVPQSAIMGTSLPGTNSFTNLKLKLLCSLAWASSLQIQ